jgi:hypothetical protein
VSCRSENLLHVHEPFGVGLKLDEELDHQGRKENKTASATNLRNELGEVIKLVLKRSAFGITSESWEPGSAALRISYYKRLTHHDTAVETLWSDGDDEVLTDTFQDLRAGNDERILLSVLVDPPLFESLLWSDFLHRVRLASGARLVASDVVTGNQNTVTRNDFTRFQKREVADKDFLRKFSTYRIITAVKI